MNIITGNKFKEFCDFILDEKGFQKTNINNSIPIYFVKTDLLFFFHNNLKPNTKYKIITHNSDYPIDNRYIDILSDDNLVSWFGQNVCTEHPKLNSIPIGIANEIWKHGDEKILKKIINEKKQKSKLIYSNFDIKTNFIERNECYNSLIKNGIEMSKKCDFEEYLTELSQHFFSVSPNGNGIDCHKLWESLYLKTIPIVTISKNIEYYKHLPIYIIDSWKNFDIFSINENLYHEIINKHDYNLIDMNYYKKIILFSNEKD